MSSEDSNISKDINFCSSMPILMNASGCHCRTKQQLDNLIEIGGLTTIITKTCTMKASRGNKEPSFLEIDDSTSINCLGMSNLGYKYYRDLFLEYHKRGINYIISIDASLPDDLLAMLSDYDTYISAVKRAGIIKIDVMVLVEINFSCPSITSCHDTTSRKRILAYDILALSRILEGISSIELVNLQIGCKLSPYLDKILLETVADLLITYASRVHIKYIVASNSIPNGMVIDTNTGDPVLSNITGGISGKINKYIAISNVWQFNNIFKKSTLMGSTIDIIGCGGIETVSDIQEYVLAGAKGVQVGHALYTGGVNIITELNKNLHSKIFIKSKL